MSGKKALPDKLFFKIGEASNIVGVKPHVLRYWESEFRSLRPLKTRGAHRVYRRQDVELALKIRALLEQEGYSIQGARKKLREDDVPMVAGPKMGWRVELLAVRADLTRLLDDLGPEPDELVEEGDDRVTADHEWAVGQSARSEQSTTLYR